MSVTREAELEATAALTALPGLGPVRLDRLLKQVGSAEAGWELGAAGIAREVGLGPAESAELAAAWRPDLGRRMLEQAARHGFRPILRKAVDYPDALLHVELPPLLLWAAGRLPQKEEPVLAMVGTRRATDSGRRLARRVAESLAAAGVGVVSGLAAGIDAACHEGALAGGAPTWGVLATGPGGRYQHGGPALLRRVRESGGLLSEFPPGHEPRKHDFRWRNRLIAALGWATVVVEAPAESGALLTVRAALELERTVLAFPGDPTRPESLGSNRLLRDGGARIVLDAEDVLAALQLETRWNRASAAEEAAALARALANLPRAERRMLEVVAAESRALSGLCEAAGVGVSTGSALLLRLELAGWIRRDASGTYHLGGPARKALGLP
ncbi:MAG: DNA-processing protein DprA [Bacillota bacterium]|nr:DNA-processing protein DprA [Bacillota bacterium]